MALKEGDVIMLGRPGFVSDPPKRGAVYEVSLEALTEILRGRIPAGGEVVAVRWNADRGCLDVKVWGDALPVVPEAYPYERRELET